MLVLAFLTLANTIAPLQSLATMLIYVELSLRVRLIGRVEKWEDKEDFNFLFSFLFGYKWKSEGIEEVNLYKFTHILLLKNYAQFVRYTRVSIVSH